MADIRKILLNIFISQHVYLYFCIVIKKIKISGFRGISNLSMDFEYPITAISGLNGAGKSTIAQLIACAFKEPKPKIKDYRRRYISSFFR
ncbi:MAG: ATP-binding protein [Tannerellaceae bacterium]|nr:ATP-binding protein [Tannerellaceae bacterium]